MNRKRLPLIIFLAIVVASAYIMMYINLRSPARVTADKGIMLSHVPRVEYREKAELILSATAAANDHLPPRLVLNYKEDKKSEGYTRTAMTRMEGSDKYVSLLPGQPKGRKTYYYIEAINGQGESVRLPEGAPKGKNLFFVRWAGSATRGLLYSHILLMVGAFVIYMHAFYFSLRSAIWRTTDRRIQKMVTAATIAFFIAGFPLGLTVAKEAFGIAWGGIPFGTDITDNKTLITLLYWLGAMVAYKKNPIDFRSKESFLVGDRTFPYLVLFGAALTLTVFVIPHSI